MTTFKEFLSEQEDPYQAFLQMRQQAGWGGMKEMPKSNVAPVSQDAAVAPTRTGTRNPLEIKLSNEVQTAHKMGGVVSRAVLSRLASSNPEDVRSFVSPDMLKAGQAYPFIQKRSAGKDVPGVYVYNQMFPLYKLLELLNLH